MKRNDFMLGFSINYKLYGMAVGLAGTSTLIGVAMNYLQVNWGAAQAIMNAVFMV